MAELALFNVDHGFVEALLRGLRSGFLGQEDYRRLSNAESMEDIRSALEETDYGSFLQDEPKLDPTTISKKCLEKLTDEFRFIKAQANEPLTTFLDFIAREKMIDNVCMIIQGAMNNKPPKDIEAKVHPLGVFDGMKVIMSESFDVTGGFDDLYNIFLIDSPIGPYFDEYLTKAHAENASDGKSVGYEASEVDSILKKEDLEIMKALLKKAWLEDFHGFVQKQGGTTDECMGHMLMMEADFRMVLICLNTLHSELSDESYSEKRNAMFPHFGYLYPEGYEKLRKAGTDATMVETALEATDKTGVYKKCYEKAKSFYEDGGGEAKSHSSIEDVMYTVNAKAYEMAFEQQYHFGIFYAWVKLKEQEIRNIRWIASMIQLGKKEAIDETVIPIFDPRM